MNPIGALALTVILAGVATDAAAHGAGAPLFKAFKTFCVDTGAKPPAVEAAVKAAGGKRRNLSRPPPAKDIKKYGSQMGPPFPLALSSWDVTVGGHAMLVNTGSAYPSRKFGRPKGRAIDFDSCSAFSWANEDASIEAIRHWVGVAPWTASTGPRDGKWAHSSTQYHYTFRMKGTKRSAFANVSALKAGAMNGQEWGLMLMRDHSSATFQLTHTLRPSADGAK